VRQEVCLAPSRSPWSQAGDENLENPPSVSTRCGVLRPLIFVAVITVSSSRSAPFSVVLTDWLSKTAAEEWVHVRPELGPASRRAVWILSHSPFLLQREKYL